MTFPGSPKLPKGAIVVVDSSTKRIVSTVAFQYNPETLTRTLQPPQVASEEKGAKVEALRLEGAPVETIKFYVEFDGTDKLEQAETNAIELGIYPQLSALETLIYPKSTEVISNMEQSKNKNIEIVPLEAPMTLLVWGNKRVLPVRITDFSITEEAYDVNLNPIRAKVTLSLRVLNYNDLPWGKPAAQLFLAYHKSKERMAVKGSVSNPAAITGVNINQRL